MNKDINEFLESGILEEYLMGTCDEDQVNVIEYYINTFPEVKEEYDRLQVMIEKSAKDLAIKPPAGMKEAIISCLNEDSNYKLKTNLVKRRRSYIPYFGWAAALIGIFLSSVFYNTNLNLKNQNMEIHASLNMLEAQLTNQENELSLLKEKLMISGHNKTSRVLLAGNNLSPEFQTTAFWNDVAQRGILYINDLGPIEKNKCYQVWADVDGEMISLGTISNKSSIIDLKYLPNATSLNITIEPKGGSEHPTVEQLISSQELIAL